jgi:hypothetical protein
LQALLLSSSHTQKNRVINHEIFEDLRSCIPSLISELQLKFWTGDLLHFLNAKHPFPDVKPKIKQAVAIRVSN